MQDPSNHIRKCSNVLMLVLIVNNLQNLAALYLEAYFNRKNSFNTRPKFRATSSKPLRTTLAKLRSLSRRLSTMKFRVLSRTYLKKSWNRSPTSLTLPWLYLQRSKKLLKQLWLVPWSYSTTSKAEPLLATSITLKESSSQTSLLVGASSQLDFLVFLETVRPRHPVPPGLACRHLPSPRKLLTCPLREPLLPQPRIWSLVLRLAQVLFRVLLIPSVTEHLPAPGYHR